MSRNGTLLPAPPELFAPFLDAWALGNYERFPFPRSQWLRDVEDALRGYFSPERPSSADLRLTARHAAPFFLLEGHDVP